MRDRASTANNQTGAPTPQAASPQVPAPQAPPAPAASADSTGQALFVVLLDGVRIGTEAVNISRNGDNWTLSGTSRLQAPIDLVINKFELTYGADWQAQQLSIEATQRGQLLSLGTTFGATTATNSVTQNTERVSNTVTVSPRAVVLPDNFFSAYEALALRVGNLPVGSRIPIYIAPRGEIFATLNSITPRRVVLPDHTIDLREVSLTFGNSSGPVTLEMWIDSRNRMARLVSRVASIAVVRSDLASVMAREEGLRNATDEEAFIPARGFTLGSTVTRAIKAPARAPAVVLVPSSTTQDRDGTLYGTPVLGRLAGALAEAGFVVVRYDKRGLGQSGGRTENAGVAEFAEDVTQIVEWLRRRRDVDGDRIAVVGYGDGASVALSAAARLNRIKAVALLASNSRPGREAAMEQQQHLLAQLQIPEAEKAAKIALQQRVIDAAIADTGWDALPQEVRRQADTAWFRTWLQFDPAAAIARVRQPILILQGALDAEIPTSHADRLEALSTGRKNARPADTRKVVVPGVNHLLVPAATGDPDEYLALTTRGLSPDVTAALSGWLKDVLTGR